MAPPVANERADAARAAGNTAFSGGDFAGAVAGYTQSLAADPNQPTVLSNRAMAHLKLGSFAEAEADCKLGLELLDAVEGGKLTLLPGATIPAGLRVKLLYRRGLACDKQGRYGDAAGFLQAVLRIEPDNARVASELVEVRQRELATPASPVPTPASSTPKAAASSPSPAPSGRAEGTPGKGPAGSPAPASTPSPGGGGAGTPGSGSRRGDKTAQMVARAPKIIPVVPQPPKTGYDFEKDVLSLLKYPAVLFKYIRTLKLVTFPRLFRSQLDPTLVSNLLVSIKSALTEEGEVAVDAAAADTAVGFVVALTKTNSFDMTRMMFVDSDKTVSQALLSAAAAKGASSALVAEASAGLGL